MIIVENDGSRYMVFSMDVMYVNNPTVHVKAKVCRTDHYHIFLLTIKAKDRFRCLIYRIRSALLKGEIVHNLPFKKKYMNKKVHVAVLRVF